MNWNDEVRVIDRAVAEMKRQGVAVTPGRVELVVNAVKGQPPLSKQVEEAWRAIGDPRLIVSVNDETGHVSACLAPNTNTTAEGTTAEVKPVPFFRLADARRAELESQAAVLRIQAGDRHLSVSAQRSAAMRLAQVERELQLDGATGRPPRDRESGAPTDRHAAKLA